jgi:hypothetical protein
MLKSAIITAILYCMPFAASAQARVTTWGVTLTWTAPTNSGNLPVCTPAQLLLPGQQDCYDPAVGYNTYRAPAGSTSYQQVNIAVTTTTLYLDLTVEPAQTYVYIVESVDVNGTTSPASNTATAVVPALPPTPSQPTVTVIP